MTSWVRDNNPDQFYQLFRNNARVLSRITSSGARSEATSLRTLANTCTGDAQPGRQQSYTPGRKAVLVCKVSNA